MPDKKVNDELMSLLNSMQKKFEAFPFEDRNAYAAWVSQTHYFTRHSTRLLALAGALTPLASQDFHNRFIAHCAEEKGHEKLLMNDMKTLGGKMEDWPEMPGACALYQSQYYYIEHRSPMAFFGYILCLEALAAHFGDYLNKRIEKAWGPKAAHFIRVHAEEDPGHTEEALHQVAELSPEDQALVLQNMRQSFCYYEQMLGECQEISLARGQKAA